MSIANKSWMITTLLGWCVLGLTAGVPAYADGHYKLTYEKLCGADIACTTFNYCTGCHNGLVVGTTVIGKGKMKSPPSNYQEWVRRLQRMSVMGCHIPKVLLPSMATYLDSLDNAPLTAKEKARMKAEAREAARNPGKSNVEYYCIGCHDGLVVGTTVIGTGFMKPKPRTYEQWVEVVQSMSLREVGGGGAHIPPALIPGMAAYLDSLDNPVTVAPATK